MYKRNILIAGVAMALLSGCGGEGSNEIVPTPDSTFADLTYGQPYEFDAVSQSFTYTKNADETHVTSLTFNPHLTTSSESLESLESLESTEFTYGSDDSGNPNYAKIEDHQTGVEFTISDVSNFVAVDYDNRLVSAKNIYDTEEIVFVNPTTVGFEYQTFGLWDKDISLTSGRGGTFSVGNTTPESSIPTSGTATYQGIAAGYTTDTNGEIGVATADFAAEADFSSRSLTISTTDTTVVLVSTGVVSMPEHNMSGTLSYTAGSGTFNGIVSTDSGYTGEATGKFYGPNANEIGGVITIPLGNNVSAVALGFGAKQ